MVEMLAHVMDDNSTTLHSLGSLRGLLPRYATSRIRTLQMSATGVDLFNMQPGQSVPPWRKGGRNKKRWGRTSFRATHVATAGRSFQDSSPVALALFARWPFKCESLQREWMSQICETQSGRPDSNRQHSAWKADSLPL